MTGNATGTANAFTISGSGGLAGLSYAPGSSGLTLLQSAANAGFSLNGVAISSGSNTIDGVVPGLTMTLTASSTGGVMVVTGPGPAQGLDLQVAAGVTGALGQATVGQGLFGALSSIVNSAPASGTCTITSEITSLNTTITSMNPQITALQQEAQQETLSLTQQYGTAQATLSQLLTVSSFLSTYFNQPVRAAVAAPAARVAAGRPEMGAARRTRTLCHPPQHPARPFGGRVSGPAGLRGHHAAG